MNYTNKLAEYIGVGIIAITSIVYTGQENYAKAFYPINRVNGANSDNPNKGFRDPNDPRFKPKTPKGLEKYIKFPSIPKSHFKY